MIIPEQLKLTYDDYANLPNDGKRHEIIDGEHFLTPAPQPRHQIVSINLTRILANYVNDSDMEQNLTIFLSEVFKGPGF